VQGIGKRDGVKLPEEATSLFPGRASVCCVKDGGVIAGDRMRYRPAFRDGDHIDIRKVPRGRYGLLFAPRAALRVRGGRIQRTGLRRGESDEDKEQGRYKARKL